MTSVNDTTLADDMVSSTATAISTTTLNTTTSGGFFDPKGLSESWEKNKVTVAWLVPVIVVVVILMVMLSLALFYMIRGAELWILKCCHRNCCCPQKARTLETEYTSLTATLHDDHDTVTLKEMERREESLWGGHTDKRD